MEDEDKSQENCQEKWIEADYQKDSDKVIKVSKGINSIANYQDQNEVATGRHDGLIIDKKEWKELYPGCMMPID